MSKRSLLYFILTVMILQFSIVDIYASENVLEMNTLFNCDFDSGVQPTDGEIQIRTATLSSEGERSFLRANSRNGTVEFFVYPEKWLECDSALVSFDFRTDSTICRSYMDIFNATADGSRPSIDTSTMNRAWYITQKSFISSFESFIPPCGTAASSTAIYSANIWYHLDMWIDYRENTVTYYVDGGDIGKREFNETFTGIGGFRITVDQTGGGANFDFDNIMVVSFPKRGGKIPLEGIAIPDNFENPITIDYKSSENMLGYIFPSKKVKLTATFENVTDSTEDVVVNTVISDTGNIVLKEFSKDLRLKTNEEKKLIYELNVEHYGFYNISTVVEEKQTGNVLSETAFQFSVMNAPPEGVKNPKVSICDHSADGHGYEEMERKYELFSLAGFNGVRTGMGVESCPDRGSDDFTLSKAAFEQNIYASRHNLEQLINLDFGKTPPVDSSEYLRWEKYVEEIVLQHLKTKVPGTLTRYDVWNEYNGAAFNYNGATAADYVELLKHTYPVIKRLDKNSEVRGFVASPTYVPAYSQDATDWIREVLELGGGDYMDVADIHPYNHTAPENTNSFRGRFIDATRDLLDEFGYADMPIAFSEMGWSTPGTVDEAGQGAYFIRWITMNFTKFKDVFLYVSQVKQTTSTHENGFGLIRSWNKKGADGYIPYSAKPAFLAVANYNTIMSGATFVNSSYNSSNGVYNYKFNDRNGNDVQIVWRYNGSGESYEATIQTSAENIAVIDMYGNDYPYKVTDGGIKVTLTSMPIYVQELVQPPALNAYVNYNNGAVTISGNTNAEKERIGITVTDETYGPLNPSRLVYVDQTTADSNGNFSVKFNNSKKSGDFTVKVGFNDGAKETEINMSMYIPTVLVNSKNGEITKLNQLEAGEDLTVSFSRFGMALKGKDTYAAIAQYKGGRLVNIEMTDITAGSKYAELKTKVENDVNIIKILYWDKSTLLPLMGVLEIR